MSALSSVSESSTNCALYDPDERSYSFIETVVEVRDYAALFFYSSARFLITPLWKSTSLWLESISLLKKPNTSTCQKVVSVVKCTLFSCALLPFTLVGFVLGQTFHFAAYHLATTPYIHLKGGLKAQPSLPSSIFQLNACLTAGGFARLFGGLELSDAERVGKIAEMIRTNHPDLACLQEVSDQTSAFSLYQKLFPEFAEFYLNIGSTPFILQNNSGLFVASKSEISQPQWHSFSNIAGTESMVNKGFFVFSTPSADFINTHLSPSSDDLHPTDAEKATRAEELRRIHTAVNQKFSENNRPVFVVGDLNTVLSNQPSAPCETEYLLQRNWHHNSNAQPQGLSIDYFLSFFHSAATTRVIPTFDLNHPEEAISDHPALLSQIA